MKEVYKQLNKFDFKVLIFDLVKSILIYLAVTLAALCLTDASVMKDNIFGVYMLSVALTSTVTSGYLCGILASVGSVIGVNFFFTFPYFALNFGIAGYPITFTLMLLLSILVSFLTTKIKKAAILSEEGKKRAETLNEMSKAILTANDLDAIIEISANYFHQASQSSIILYLGSPMTPKKTAMKTLAPDHEQILTSILERQVAAQALGSGRITGANVQGRSQNCRGTYFPIVTEEGSYGVLGILFDDMKPILDDTYSYINVMLSQMILALQRQQANEKAQEILLETEKEKMRSNLLRAVSHDLRTPLTGIIGATSTLLENHGQIDAQQSRRMLLDIQQDAEWLIHMVENLLSVTRISGGSTQLKKQDEIVEEVVAEAASKIRKRFPGVKIDVSVPEQLLIVPMDATLIEQVLINLMENAIRHSGSTLPIGLRLFCKKSGAVFTVSDHGKGIDPSRIPDLFDGKPSTGSSDSSRGLGIGLSICKSIILAHDGKIFAKNNQSGGASITFVLPMKGEQSDAE